MNQVADISITKGAPMVKTENARPNAWIYVDLDTSDLGGYVERARKIVDAKVTLPAGVSLAWSGQYEYMERVSEKLKMIVPITLGIVFVLLFLNFQSVTQSLLVMLTVPLSAVGGVLYIDYLGFNFSVAVGVGFIALVGIAAEIGVLILTYIDHAIARRKQEGMWNSVADVRAAVLEGVSERVKATGSNLLILKISHCPNLLTDRSLWLASCYCRALQAVTYR